MLNSYYIERNRMQRRGVVWRSLAVFFLLLLCLSFIPKSHTPKEYIGKIPITGEMLSDEAWQIKTIKRLGKDENVKAIILSINSPGGYPHVGEAYFREIRKATKNKPVVTTVSGGANSAAYLTASASNYIIAYDSSMVGSIGVFLSAYEITDLLSKIGITPVMIKSDPLKAMPNLFQKMTPEATKAIEDDIQMTKKHLISTIRDRRPQVSLDAFDARSFSGSVALDYGLIDAIGDEDTATAWLTNYRGIPDNLEVIEVVEEDVKSEPLLERLIIDILGKATKALMSNPVVMKYLS